MNCKYCNSPIEKAATGRVREFCLNSCRQAHYRLVKNGYQRQRQSAALKALVLRNDERIRNAKLKFDQPSAGAGVFQQVDWTV